MRVKTINLPIYDLDIVVIINDWVEANKRLKLGIEDDDLMNAQAWSIENFVDTRGELYLLYRDGFLDNGTLIHEIVHCVLEICDNRGIVVDFQNQEPVTYLAGYIGEQVFAVVEKYKQGR
jgi:hypothetical protein